MLLMYTQRAFVVASSLCSLSAKAHVFPAAGYGASSAQYAQYGAASGQQPAAGYGAAGIQQAQPQGAGGYGASGTSYGSSAYQQVCAACA